MNYGNRLTHARKRKALTQVKLEAISGVPQGTISKIERGDQLDSSYDSILAYHLDCSAIWLSREIGSIDTRVLSDDEQKIIQAYREGSAKLKSAFECLTYLK